MLGPPASIRWRAGFAQPNVDEPVMRQFTLDAFDLCPLDLVYLAGERAAQAPLTELIRMRLKQQGPDGQGREVRDIHLYLDREDNQPEGTLSLDEALSLGWAMQRMLTESRALAGEDLHLAAWAPPPGPIDGAALTELQGRVTSARARIDALRNAYSADDNLANWWRAALLTGPVDPELADGPVAILADLSRRTAQADAVDENDPGKAALLRIAALLGKQFRVLPLVRTSNGSAVEAAFADQNVLLENDSTRPSRWLHDYARVRRGCEAMDLFLTLAEALQRPAPLIAGQLPVMPGQPWIGERLPADTVAPRLSLVAHAPAALMWTADIAGLSVDSWSEVVPSPRVTTGLTFHYDEPKSQAPQALLLAVPPDLTRGWDFQSLEAALLETFELAKLRGMVAEELSDPDYPAGYLEFYRPALHLSGNQKPEMEAVAQGA